MRKIMVVVGVLVLLAATLPILLSTGAWKALGSHYQQDETIQTPVTLIRVANPGLASVDIRRGGAAQVRIHCTVRYLSPLRGRPPATYHLDGSTLYLDQAGFLRAVDYVVDVPEGVTVQR